MRIFQYSFRALLSSLFLACSIAVGISAEAPDLASIGGDAAKLGEWNGFARCDFEYDGRSCIVVAPKESGPGVPWIWRARFFGHEPQTDLTLLSKGFHLVYMNVSSMYGAPVAVAHWNGFYKYLTEKHGFAKKAVIEGMSRGGLIAYNWAKANPEKVACIYVDAPVCDIRSWPGGMFSGKGSRGDWERCKAAYGLSDEEAADFKGNPLDGLEALAKAGVPLLHVCGAADDVVPMAENTDLLRKTYEGLGGAIRVVSKEGVGHHPHSLEDPALIVNFILGHTFGVNDFIVPRAGLANSARIFKETGKGRVAFIGGSITEMEGYRPRTYKSLEALFPQTKFDFLNAGVSSTSSTTGAFRIASDGFGKGEVDLLFIEFAVNDDQDADHTDAEMVRAMEGMVIHARKRNPLIDIVFLYTANGGHIALFQSGKIPHEIAAHEQVAEHYGIPSVCFAADVAQRMELKEFDWKKFGGVHPAPFGADIYADDIACLLKAGVGRKGKPKPHRMPDKPLDSLNYGGGRFLAIDSTKTAEGWSVIEPDWKSIPGAKRGRFVGFPMLVSETPGAIHTVNFEGTAIGVYIVAGPDAGILECSIDGSEPKEFDLFHKYSKGLHYPRTVMFATDLKPGKHILKLVTSGGKNPASKGNAVRIMTFVENRP